MTTYLIVNGDDNDMFFVETETLLDAVFKLMEYTGTKIKPVCEKALRAMETATEIIELYNRFDSGYNLITAVYEIGNIIYRKGDEEK